MISMIVPLYNAEKYLNICVDSILKQTYTDFELILVDDGSTDRSRDICDKYTLCDDRIKVFHKKNAGVSEARNTGISAANGKYIGFIDADDWVEPTYLESLLRGMSEGGFSVCGVLRDYDPPVQESCVKKLTRAEAEISVFSTGGIHGWCFARLFDGAVLKQNQILFDKDISQCEDELFCIKYLSCITGFTTVSDEAKYHYRSNPKGALRGRYCKKTPDKRDFSEIIALERMESLIEEDHAVVNAWKQRRDKAAAATLRTMISCHYSNKVEIKRLKKIVRCGCLRYLLGDVGALSSKMSMLLSAISPELEWAAFKRISLR